MYAVFDFLPKFCPTCGMKLRLSSSDWYFKGAYTQSCPNPRCGLNYRIVTKAEHVAAKQLDGDMSNVPQGT